MNKWKLGVTTGAAQRPRERQVPAGDGQTVLEEIRRAKHRFGLPEEGRVVSCYEAGRDGFWLHRFLVSHGASIMAPATLSTLAYPVARCGGLRGAGGISTDARIAANIDRGFCPKNRSAAVVPSERVRKKLWIAVRHARFLGRSKPRS